MCNFKQLVKAFLVSCYCLLTIRNDSVKVNDTTAEFSLKNEAPQVEKELKKENTFLSNILSSKPALKFFRNLVSACFRPRMGDLRLIMGLLFFSKMIGYAGQMMVEGNLLFLFRVILIQIALKSTLNLAFAKVNFS